MKKELVIMIVDDNVNFIHRMTGLLEELDNIGSIHVATDYDGAIQLLGKQIPDFVLLDINLPGKNGIELLKAIKKRRWKSEVIMLTNHADDYYRQQCKELGAEHFLDKTNDFGLVAGIINKGALLVSGPE